MNPSAPTPQQLDDAARMVYAVLRSRESVVRALNPAGAWKTDLLLCEFLEWGWEHHAPPGKRYQFRETRHLRLDMDLIPLVTLPPEEALKNAQSQIDALLEQTKEVVASSPIESVTMQGHPVAYFSDTTVVVFSRIVFLPPASETETPLPS